MFLTGRFDPAQNAYRDGYGFGQSIHADEPGVQIRCQAESRRGFADMSREQQAFQMGCQAAASGQEASPGIVKGLFTVPTD